MSDTVPRDSIFPTDFLLSHPSPSASGVVAPDCSVQARVVGRGSLELGHENPFSRYSISDLYFVLGLAFPAFEGRDSNCSWPPGTNGVDGVNAPGGNGGPGGDETAITPPNSDPSNTANASGGGGGQGGASTGAFGAGNGGVGGTATGTRRSRTSRQGTGDLGDRGCRYLSLLI
jgi:hypothetical protein